MALKPLLKRRVRKGTYVLRVCLLFCVTPLITEKTWGAHRVCARYLPKRRKRGENTKKNPQ